MALSAEDRDWLEEKFSRVHDRIDQGEMRAQKRESDIHKLDLAVTKIQVAGCPSVAAHEEAFHNPVKTWGLLAAIVGVFTGVAEGIKHLFGGK